MARPIRSFNRPAGTARRRCWQLQEAKARFSEVFRLVRSEGPQRVNRQGKETIVLVSAERYEALEKRRERSSLLEFFARSPLAGVELKWHRPRDVGRMVDL